MFITNPPAEPLPGWSSKPPFAARHELHKASACKFVNGQLCKISIALHELAAAAAAAVAASSAAASLP